MFILCDVHCMVLHKSFYTGGVIWLNTSCLFFGAQKQLSAGLVKLIWIIQVSVPGSWWISQDIENEIARGSSAQESDVTCYRWKKIFLYLRSRFVLLLHWAELYVYVHILMWLKTWSLAAFLSFTHILPFPHSQNCLLSSLH